MKPNELLEEIGVIPESSSGIYIDFCLVNGKAYIGSSKNVKRRFAEHKSRLRKGTHPNLHLQNSWDKYTPNGFGFFTLQVASDGLSELEAYYLSKLDPNCRFNLAAITDKVMMSNETKEKISKARKGSSLSDEIKEKKSQKPIEVRSIQRKENNKY